MLKPYAYIALWFDGFILQILQATRIRLHLLLHSALLAHRIYPCPNPHYTVNH